MWTAQQPTAVPDLCGTGQDILHLPDYGTGVGLASQMALTSFELGRLKLLAHVREELDRAGIEAQAIQCKSGDLQTPPGVARLTIIANATPATLDFTSTEIEQCKFIVAGEPWHKIAAFIARLAR
jgi:hypothetical protein